MGHVWTLLHIYFSYWWFYKEINSSLEICLSRTAGCRLCSLFLWSAVCRLWWARKSFSLFNSSSSLSIVSSSFGMFSWEYDTTNNCLKILFNSPWTIRERRGSDRTSSASPEHQPSTTPAHPSVSSSSKQTSEGRLYWKRMYGTLSLRQRLTHSTVKPVTMTFSSFILALKSKSHWWRVVIPILAFSSRFSCTDMSR